MMPEEPIAIRTPYQMTERLLSLPKGTEVEVRAPVGVLLLVPGDREAVAVARATVGSVT